MAGILGVDISHWQRLNTRIPALKRRGVKYVIMKASQGDWEDAAFNGARLEGGKRTHFFRDTKDAGLLPGAYHFLEGKGHAGNTPKTQARTFVRVVKRANGGTLNGVIMALDDEAYAGNPKPREARDFANEYFRLTNGRPLFIYTTASRLARYDLDSFKGPTRLWLAWWTCNHNSGCSVNASGSSTNHRIPDRDWDKRFNGKKPIIRQFTNGLRFPNGAHLDGNWTEKTLTDLVRLADDKDEDGGFPSDGGGSSKPKPKTGTNPFLEDWLDSDAPETEGQLQGGLGGIAALGIGGAILAGAAILLVAAVGMNVREKTTP